jgi:gliding motility-associated-like protein
MKCVLAFVFLGLFIQVTCAQPIPQHCNPSSIIWGCSTDEGLYWANLATGDQHHVKDIRLFIDLAWGSNGKLYGCGGDIWEIDPATGDTSVRRTLPEDYLAGNAMTSDAAGNLYLVAHKIRGQPKAHIIKLNLADWKVCLIIDLVAAGLASEGDLTFLNGNLYLTCNGGDIAKINVATGEFERRTIINNPSSINGFYGLTITGDGYFYVSDKDKIYRIDPVTMIADPTPVFTFTFPGIYLLGIACYTETCHAPQCATKLAIQPSKAPPYCTNEAIELLASASTACNAGRGEFTWTTPSGDIITGNKVTARDAGMYYIRYRLPSDTCSSTDSFLLQQEPCEVSIFFPTAFTPNNDGLNDVFKPEARGNSGRISQYEFCIYNRWGELIFKTPNITEGWNGTIGGVKQATNTFIWSCRYKIGNGEKSEKGTFVLIR